RGRSLERDVPDQGAPADAAPDGRRPLHARVRSRAAGREPRRPPVTVARGRRCRRRDAAGAALGKQRARSERVSHREAEQRRQAESARDRPATRASRTKKAAENTNRTSDRVCVLQRLFSSVRRLAKPAVGRGRSLLVLCSSAALCEIRCLRPLRYRCLRTLRYRSSENAAGSIGAFGTTSSNAIVLVSPLVKVIFIVSSSSDF